MTIFNITIISDTVCPWCYIGYRRLQKAIQLFQKTFPGGSSDEFKITWKPYYLVPDAPAIGLPMSGRIESNSVLLKSSRVVERMRERMGAKRAEEAQNHMQRVGTGEGITFDFNGRTGNSKMSQRLMYLAGSTSPEAQTKLAEELFRGHFEERKDIADEKMLLEAAVQVGLDKESAKSFLESEQVAEKVDEEAAGVKESGIRGVPHIIFDEGHHFDGAVDVGDLFEALLNIKQGLAK